MKKRIQCDNCKKFFDDSKLTKVTPNRTLLQKLIDVKVTDGIYCDDCIDNVS